VENRDRVGWDARPGPSRGVSPAAELVARRKEECSGQDEYPEEIDARLGQLEMAMEAFEARPLIHDPAEVGRAGAFVTLDRNGSLAVYRGYVRPEDELREETAVQDGDNAQIARGRGLMPVAPAGRRQRPPWAAWSSPLVVNRSALTCPRKKMMAR
jgi:ParB family chromosome partitioning protein